MAISRITNVNFGNSQLNYIHSINYLIKYQIEYDLKYLCKLLYIYKPWKYVAKEFLTKNIQRKPTLFSWNPLIMKCLGTSKFKIFWIWLKFQSVYNLIKYLPKNFNESPFLNVSYKFLKFNGLIKWKCDFPCNVTQSYFQPNFF